MNRFSRVSGSICCIAPQHTARYYCNFVEFDHQTSPAKIQIEMQEMLSPLKKTIESFGYCLPSFVLYLKKKCNNAFCSWKRKKKIWSRWGSVSIQTEDIINGDSFIMLSYVGILRWWNMDSYYSLFWFRWRQTLDPFDLSCVKSRAPRWGLTIRHSGTWAHSGNNVRHATSPGVSLKRYIKTCLEFRVVLRNGSA